MVERGRGGEGGEGGGGRWHAGIPWVGQRMGGGWGRGVGKGGLNQSGVYQTAPVIRELTKKSNLPPTMIEFSSSMIEQKTKKEN